MNQAESETGPGAADPEERQAPRLRLLSYNIQVGIRTSAYRQYLTGGWKHLLPHRGRMETLCAIADQIRGYDLVAVQETDSGSLRTGFVNQTEHLARLAGFDWWTDRTNRRLGNLAQHSIGALSRLAPDHVEALGLPGPVRGRGALLMRFGEGDDALGVAVVHLALGRQTRRQQLSFLAERLKDFRHAVVMGDFNAPHGSPEMREFFVRTGLVEPAERFNTWPSWRPAQNYDHILVTPDLVVARFSVLADSHSDHLPVALELTLPGDLVLPAPNGTG